MNFHQGQLPSTKTKQNNQSPGGYLSNFVTQLSSNLDFHDGDSGYSSHNYHSFPAKFPPQLPRKFITTLTTPGDVILDPMVGSGTTVLEAYLLGRLGVGFDIDPLALLLANAKVIPLSEKEVAQFGERIIVQATNSIRNRRIELEKLLSTRWDPKTKDFVDYWFAHETQIDLLALILEIEKIEDEKIRAFFNLVFSSVIITKSGGVSLAFDLAHTRPHRAKVVYNRDGNLLMGQQYANDPNPRIQLLTKKLRLPLDEFKKRFRQNLGNITNGNYVDTKPKILYGDAQDLPLDDESVDLIITSPPYAANAIDYMRAHKFSLVWMGYPIDDLGRKRKEYIGGDALALVEFETLPGKTYQVVSRIAGLDEKKGKVLHRYFSEMTRALREMYRVLKPGKSAIVVVGNSIMRGKDTETQTCLAEIGQAIGFEVPKIGVRQLDRNRRMLPAGAKVDKNSQIQQRMHEEYVIGFYKPHS